MVDCARFGSRFGGESGGIETEVEDFSDGGLMRFVHRGVGFADGCHRYGMRR